jgi:hypothetical protein
LNTRNVEYDLPNRPDNMNQNPAGLNPSRWGANAESDV